MYSLANISPMSVPSHENFLQDENSKSSKEKCTKKDLIFLLLFAPGKGHRQIVRTPCEQIPDGQLIAA